MPRLKEYLLVIASVCPAWSQAAPGWRYWSTADGLRESYTANLAIGAGAVWAKHGDVETLSKLDGYVVKGIPDPGAVGPIAAGPDGDLWLFAGTSIRRFHASQWTTFGPPELRAWAFETDANQQWRLRNGPKDSAYAAALYPLGNGRVLLLLPDRILVFDAATQSSRTLRLSSATGLSRFSGMYAGMNGRIWVAGSRGIAAMAAPMRGGRPDDPLAWVEHPGPPGFSEFEEVHEGDNGDALVIASSGQGKSALRFDGTKWNVLYTSRAARLRAWHGADDDVWVQEDDAILRLTGSKRAVTDEQLPPSGRIIAVTQEAGGAFWLATSQGIVRHAPRSGEHPGRSAILCSILSRPGSPRTVPETCGSLTAGRWSVSTVRRRKYTRFHTDFMHRIL